MSATLCLIPARGGSKGLPGKNLRPVGGISLVGRATLAAREFARLAGLAEVRVFVDTDDETIAEEARRWGASVPFLRPPELAGDTVPTVVSVIAALERLDHSFIEASLDLGAGHLRAFWTVIVPLAMPGIASALIITFIPALGTFLQPDLLGGTDSSLIANVIERQFRSANDWPFGSALSLMLLYITFIAIALQAFFSRRRQQRGREI